MLYIGTDHGGFRLKEALLPWLKEQAISFYDEGTYSPVSCDYPLFSERVARAVQANKKHRGFLICSSGVGMAIVANKFKGIYAACLTTEEDVRKARQHNAINVLCVPGSIPTECAQQMVHVLLTAEASMEERHIRRRQQILALEGKMIHDT